VLLENLDDLLFGESALAHVRLPKERPLHKTGAFKGAGHRGGEQDTKSFHDDLQR
jgi:hypothetical protein